MLTIPFTQKTVKTQRFNFNLEFEISRSMICDNPFQNQFIG